MSHINANIPAHFSREMGITLDAFQRTLPAATNSLGVHWDGRSVTIEHPQGSIRIDLATTQERRLGAFRLPVTTVTFAFTGLDAESRQKFIERFDLCFHRGGG